MTQKELISKIGRKGFAVAATVAVSCGATYLVCNSMYESEVENLRQQITELREKEAQARVTQRISEQMEEIASQQSLISDKERERAEEQSRIADLERGKAEIERGLAMEAQRHAVEAAAEAKRSQQLAETQSVLATNNMIAAEEARAHADTLLFSSLANSLAQTSITQYQTHNFELASLLSYAAWHFANKYSPEDTRQQNIYKALLYSSNTVNNLGIGLKGNIRRIRVVNGETIAISDYGEVIILGTTQIGFEFGRLQYRDFVAKDRSNVIAMEASGKISAIDLSEYEKATKDEDIPVITKLHLPDATWTRLCYSSDGKQIIAMSDKSIAWIDATTLQLISITPLDERPTCIGTQGEFLHVFTANGGHLVSTEAGILAPTPVSSLTENDYATSYLYNKAYGYHIIGTCYGHILIFNEKGEKQTEFVGHNGQISDLHVWGDLLGSSCYDSTFRLWSLDNLKVLNTPVTLNFDYWPLTFDVDERTNTVWIGTEKGIIPHFCSSIKHNAELTRKSLTRDFTQDEWDFYIGKGIEKINFLGQ